MMTDSSLMTWTIKEMFANDDGFFTDDLDDKEMFANDDGFFTDDLDDEEMFANDDGFLSDDSYMNMNGPTSTGNLQLTKRHKPVILLKNKVTETPLLCRPNVNIHPSHENI